MRGAHAVITPGGFASRHQRPARRRVRSRPARFGRGRPLLLETPAEHRSWTVPDDVQLFATTFAAGFLFVAILIG